jgi:hypothetical protein
MGINIKAQGSGNRADGRYLMPVVCSSTLRITDK